MAQIGLAAANPSGEASGVFAWSGGKRSRQMQAATRRSWKIVRTLNSPFGAIVAYRIDFDLEPRKSASQPVGSEHLSLWLRLWRDEPF